MEINSFDNKKKTAIVCVGYNRINSLKRLLHSLELAIYPNNDIPLVLSIDASGNQALYDFVLSYHWKYGEKYTIIHKERLGLKNHIFSCGDLTQYFDSIILLEDDIYVSPYFYHFSLSALKYYSNENSVACVGLYSYASNVFASLPFTPFQTNFDVYGIQATITWGECWNSRMWNGFRRWLNENPELDWSIIDIPLRVKNFKKAWSKYFTAYLSENNKYIIAPYKSYSTNFSESGEHNDLSSAIVQVPFVRRLETFQFAPFPDLIKYNSFFNPVELESFLPKLDGDLYVNLYGIRENNRNCRYELTTDILPYKVIKSYALSMRPIDANIRYQLEGEGIFLYDLFESNNSGKKDINPIQSIQYRLSLFRPQLLLKYLLFYLKVILLSKIRIRK